MPLLDFSIGDPQEPTVPAIPETLRSAVPVVSNYPTTRGLAALRRAVAGYIERRFSIVVDPETQVLPTSGSKEAIFSSHLAFVDRSAADGVIFPTPGYPIYERGAVFAGAQSHPVALEGDFVFRPEQVSPDAWAGSSMVWVCSPHNPAGSVTDMATLRRFVDRGRESGTLVCADECYIDLYDDEAPPSVLQVTGSEASGVLSFLSLSKRSGMTGYRSGAIVGDPEAIAALATLRTSTGTASPEFTQAAAIVAWSDDAHVAERRKIFAEKRRLLRAAFEEADLPVIGSAAGLYLWVKVGDDLGATERLLDHHVVVSPGRAFGRGGEGYIRLAMVPTVEECAEAAKVVTECLKN